jgi:hypothetical protein
MAERRKPYNEAGRRIKAALISYSLGLAGVDSTLKRIPEDPGEGWAEVAEQLLREMTNELGNELLAPHTKGPQRVK